MNSPLLPGGVFIAGKLHRDYRFKPLTGELELSLAESAEMAGCTADRVTSVLTCALESLAGQRAEVTAVANLVVGDRQFLMRQLCILLDDSPRWLTAVCGHCDNAFDLNFQPSSLPVKIAGEGFPDIWIKLGSVSHRLRLPTGADQAGLDGSKSAEQQQRDLLATLLTPTLDAASLSTEEFNKLDQALEAMAPEVALHLLASCPHCHAENTVALDPYEALDRSPDDLLRDIHSLASHYHWSQREILDLPRRRRHHYLRLIDGHGNGNHMEAGY